MTKRIFFIIAILITVVFNFALAQTNKFPVPAGNANQLFYLQRTTNTNTIICELNMDKGLLDKDDPCTCFLD